MVILQNCLDILRGEQESCTETCSVSSGDEKQFVFINDDYDTFIKLQENPEPTTSTALKNDPVVSVYPMLCTFYRYCLLPVCPSVPFKHLN
jgi:hypothetical protein